MKRSLKPSGGSKETQAAIEGGVGASLHRNSFSKSRSVMAKEDELLTKLRVIIADELCVEDAEFPQRALH